jgi:hypothetical protein
MITTIDGKIHHLKELDFIERLLYNRFNPESYYYDLSDYMRTKLVLGNREYITPAEVKLIDQFTEMYFEGKIPDAQTWLIRAYIYGRFTAEADRELSFIPRITAPADIPQNLAEIGKRFNLTESELRAVRFLHDKTALNITNTTQDTIRAVRRAITDSIQKREGIGGAEKRLQELVFSDVGELNRDWKRIAITETNQAFADGYVGKQQHGDFVIGVSMPDACPSCFELIHNKVYQVTKTPPPDYSNLTGDQYREQATKWEKFVWEGKTNTGRSSAKRKRLNPLQGNATSNLREREHHEQAMPAIPLHPSCRCRWISFDPDLQWVDETGQIKFKFENPAGHQKFYETEILGI